MFGSLGAPELIIVAIFLAAPLLILVALANSWGLSRSYALWGLLGWIGLVIGIILMAISRGPANPPPPPPTRPGVF